jgi:hypothetical protein
MSDWREDGDAIVRDFELKDFAAAMAFVNQVGEMAEAPPPPGHPHPRLEQGAAHALDALRGQGHAGRPRSRRGD